MESKFEKASQYAIKYHLGQRRKDGTVYILHPFEVAAIAATMTNDDDVLSAAILHDTVEDSTATIEEIYNLFGEKVAKIVELETEKKYPNLDKNESWKIRKQEALKRLNQTDEIGFKIVYLSDKLSNIRSLFRDFQAIGYHAFDKFNVNNIEEQAWYYYSILNSLSELKDYETYKELEQKINIIFKDFERSVGNGKSSYHK